VLARGLRDLAVAMIWDPVAVALAAKAGEGAVLNMRIGGKCGPFSGDPLDVRARVLRVRADARQSSPMSVEGDALGLAAAVEAEGVCIILNSIRQQTFSPDCFAAFGIDPSAQRLLVVKSSQHFYAMFQHMAAKIIYCDAPGSLNSDLFRMPYTRLRRPIWPLDDISYP